MSVIHRLTVRQKSRALSEGIKIVRDVLKSNFFPNGFTTLQLFRVAVKQPPPPDFPTYHPTGLTPVVKPNKDRSTKVKPIVRGVPPHPEHPIRSIRFLKVEVLPALANSCEIIKVRQNSLARMNGPEFVWRVVAPKDVPPPPRPKPTKKVVGKEVGVDLDYGHLNKRRQNARVGKITRDIEAMKIMKL